MRIILNKFRKKLNTTKGYERQRFFCRPTFNFHDRGIDRVKNEHGKLRGKKQENRSPQAADRAQSNYQLNISAADLTRKKSREKNTAAAASPQRFWILKFKTIVRATAALISLGISRYFMSLTESYISSINIKTV